MNKKNSAVVLLAVFVALFFSSFLHAQEYKDGVIFVLDASGSMADDMIKVVNGRKVKVLYDASEKKGQPIKKIDAAKDALFQAFKEIPDSTYVGVLVFSARGIRNVWVYPLGPKDPQKLKQLIRPVVPNDGTPLGSYMKIAADRLMQEREKQYNNGNYGLIVITDGEANGEPEWYVNSELARHLGQISYIDEIKSRSIRMSAIGVSMDKTHTLATEVSYRSADDPESFTRAVKESVSEVSVNSAAKTFEGSGFDGDISGLPVEVASAIVTAISTVQNHPIGTRPKPKLKPVVVPSAAVAQAPAAANQTNAQQPAQPAADPGSIVGKVLLVFLAIVAFVVVIGVLSSIFR